MAQPSEAVEHRPKSLSPASEQKLLKDIRAWFQFYDLQEFLLPDIAAGYLHNEDPEEWAKKIKQIKKYKWRLTVNKILGARREALIKLRSLLMLGVYSDIATPRQILEAVAANAAMISSNKLTQADAAMSVYRPQWLDDIRMLYNYTISSGNIMSDKLLQERFQEFVNDFSGQISIDDPKLIQQWMTLVKDENLLSEERRKMVMAFLREKFLIDQNREEFLFDQNIVEQVGALIELKPRAIVRVQAQAIRNFEPPKHQRRTWKELI